MQWSRITRELKEIKQLSDDWDGLGATAPTLNTWQRASQVFNAMRENSASDYGPPTRVVPSPEGTIVFEWQFQSLFISAEVSDDNCIYWMFAADGDRSRHWSQCIPGSDSGVSWETYYTSSTQPSGISFDERNVALV